jgi:hypothetical protein
MVLRLPARLVKAAVIVVVFGAIGVLLLTASHAATPTAVLEAENGTLATCAVNVADSTASDSHAVRFNACSGSSGNDPTNLDASGLTIPDTNYPIPASAIFMAANGSDTNPGTQAAPVQTLNKAISLVPTGGTIVARGGTYRDWYNSGGTTYKIATAGFTLQAYPHEQVWFDGSDVVSSGWTSDGAGHWYLSWNTPSFCNGHYYDFPYNNQAKAPRNLTGTSGTTYSDNQGPCSHWDQYGSSEANYPAAGDPQMVFVDGNDMPEVDTLSGATGGKFYYDWANKRIYISTNPSGHTIELAARPTALVLGGTAGGYVVRGVGFRHYATNEYNNITSGAVYIGGNGGDTIENDVFSYNAGDGMVYSASQNSAVRSSVFAYNGHDGINANGHNSKGITDNFILTGSVFNHNDNEMYGLNCSLSCAASGIKMGNMAGYNISNNIFENGQAGAQGAWCDTNCINGVFVHNLTKNNGGAGYFYEEDTAGIVAGNLSVGDRTGVNLGAANTKLYNNTYVNCSLICIRLFDDNRSLTTTGMSIGNNVVSGTSVNTNWFSGGPASNNQSDPSGWFSYYDYNSYWRPTSFVLYRLIGSADQNWKSSSTFTAAFPSWEVHATDYVGATDPFFTNANGGDYGIRSGSAAYHSGGPIPADVANALGVSTAAGQTRGAFTWPGK